MVHNRGSTNLFTGQLLASAIEGKKILPGNTKKRHTLNAATIEAS